jgi:DNA polymerase elongation subunit (family B)
MQSHCYERQGNCVIENERCIFLLFKTRNNIYASDMSAEVLSQLRSKYPPREDLQIYTQIGKGEE